MLKPFMYHLTIAFLATFPSLIRGQYVFTDLQKEMQAFPGYDDIPICGAAGLAGRVGSASYGTTHIDVFLGCETAICLCDPIRRERAIKRITDQGAFNCASDTATQTQAIAFFEAFCAVRGSPMLTETSTLSTSLSTDSISSSNSVPTSTSSPVSTSGTTTTRPQPSSTSTQSKLQQLLRCEPCGNSQCSFTNGSVLSNALYGLIVGTPVSNCNPGGRSIFSKIGGSITIGESWSVTATVGINLGLLDIVGNYERSSSRSITASQEITIEIPPGQMGVLVANAQYKRSEGSMKVGSSQAFPLIANQPMQVVDYTQEIVSCNTQFSANFSSPFSCTASTANAPMSLKRQAPTRRMGALILIMLAVNILLLISLLL